MAQVYISSTFRDLREQRKAVADTLSRLGHHVISMEHYVASTRRPLEECLADVARCDLYVGIFAWRYGFVPEIADPESPAAGNPERKSITELEYLHAVRCGKDRLVFLLDGDAPWPKNMIEEGEGAERLKAFRDRLGKDLVVDFFADTGGLTTRVGTAVAVWEQRKQSERPASPRAGRPDAAERVNITRLPVTGHRLFGRERELEILDEAWAGQATHVLSLVAWGGVGKSALVNYWLARMAHDDYRGARHVYGWSFFSQGTTDRAASSDQFIEAALVFFGDADPNRGSPWDKGERLARLVGEERALLVLDGLEPLQHPPGPEEGKLKDQALLALLRQLAAHNEGLCVLTTRISVADLSPFEGGTVNRLDLDTLSPAVGALVLRAQGARGEEADLQQASREFGGHSLALTLLGSYLSDVHGGDITLRTGVRGLEDDERHGHHAARVMTSYERWFGEGPELDVLRILGLFNRPADGGLVDALRAAPAIPGLTDHLQNLGPVKWRQILSRLRRASLLTAGSTAQPDTLDTHPLVREHFGRQLQQTNPEAWREGHSRLYDHLTRTTKEFPDTLEEMAPLYAAVTHGCAAGRHQEAATEVYWGRILRQKEFFSTVKLGAVGNDLAALANFFTPGGLQPVDGLSEAYKAFVLGQVAFRFMLLGRCQEAIQAFHVTLGVVPPESDLKNAAILATNLSELYLITGDLPQALNYARQSYEWSERDGNPYQQMHSKARIADIEHQKGNLAEAEDTFREAEEMQKGIEPNAPILYSRSGFQYCNLLLSTGEYDEVEARAKVMLQIAEQNRWLIEIAHGHLLLGEARLLRSKDAGGDELAQATDHLHRAVNGLRTSGTFYDLPRGLLARAGLQRVKGDFESAQTDLAQALDLVERGGMKLGWADCHLEYARLCLARGEEDAAGEHLKSAKELIERTGYNVRAAAVKGIEEQYGGAGS